MKPKFTGRVSNIRVASRLVGFTLIEMLVVLAVIGLLMGLSFPAIQSAIRRAKITRAQTEVQALQQAWLAYWNTYNTPVPTGPMNAAAVAILGGDNPANIVFMEFDAVSRRDGFMDPWKKLYEVKFDTTVNIRTDWGYKTRVYLGNRSGGKD